MTIDILLPFYGDPELMRKSVRSILAQEDGDWKLFVVDDGYPDETIEPWFEALNDPRIHYERNETNLGANANYTKCLSLVTSPIFVMMGADDIMLPNYLTVIKRTFADHPEAWVVLPTVRVIDENDQPHRNLVDRVKDLYRPNVSSGDVVLSGEAMATTLMRGNWTFFPALAWKTEFVVPIGFRPGLGVTQDLALLIDVAIAGGALVVVPELAFEYRRHRESDSSWRALEGTRFDEERQLFRDCARSFRGLGWGKASRTALYRTSSRLHAITLIPKAAVAGKWQGVRRLVRHSFGS